MAARKKEEDELDIGQCKTKVTKEREGEVNSNGGILTSQHLLLILLDLFREAMDWCLLGAPLILLF